MANVFNSVKGLHPRRNKFSAHTYRNDFTGKLGLNIPVYQQHVTAGTRVKVNAAALVRLQALIAPVMDNIDYYVHFWKIPYRLIEDDRFTQFISGEIEEEEYTAIFATGSEFQTALINNINVHNASGQERLNVYNALIGNGSLLDFCGYDKKLFGTAVISNGGAIAVDVAGSSKKFNYRPVIAYLMLHYHWYMNENVPYYDGFDSDMKELTSDNDVNRLCALLVNNYIFCTSGQGMLPHGWDKDYFTSALPNVQYGEPVTLGLAGSAPVSMDLAQPMYIGYKGGEQSENYPLIGSLNQNIRAETFQGLYIGNNSLENSKRGYLQSEDQALLNGIYSTLGITPAVGDTFEGTADLSEASAITINELRLANALQIFKEREQRFGRRRQEYYKGFFDVTPEDLRLQVPKYLGGGRIPINISDIEQTSTTSGESRPLGSLAGKGTAVAGSFAGFTTFCSEESVILGIAFAMPHITYAQAISKFLMKTNDRYDYFNPSFEHLGEQAIENIEIYSGATEPEGEFGYTPRFNEYRFHANEMHGQFKSTLAYWSLGRIFTSQPALNADFIYMQPNAFNRIFAVENQDNMIVSMIFHTRVIQPVSKYGTPGLMV